MILRRAGRFLRPRRRTILHQLPVGSAACASTRRRLKFLVAILFFCSGRKKIFATRLRLDCDFDSTRHAARLSSIKVCLPVIWHCQVGTQPVTSPRCFCPSNKPSTRLRAWPSQAHRGDRYPGSVGDARGVFAQRDVASMGRPVFDGVPVAGDDRHQLFGAVGGVFKRLVFTRDVSPN